MPFDFDNQDTRVLNEGISEATFYYWKKKMKRFLAGEVSPGFVPLVIRDPGKDSTASKLQSSGVENSGFEICYPNGTRLKFTPQGSVSKIWEGII